MDSLRSSYNSWSTLSLDQKIDLLAKTERKIAKASTEKVADFCIHVLSQISLENECNQNSDLITPVKNLGLRVQAKSSSIFFSSLTLTEAEHVTYILNGKNPYLAIGAAPIKASSAISESRWAFSKFGESSIDLGSNISQETCKTILILFSKSQNEQIEALHEASGKELKKLKKASECFKIRGTLKDEIDKQFKIYSENKRKVQFIDRLEACESEKVLSALFSEFNHFKNFPEAEKILLRLIEKQYSSESSSPLSDDAIELLCWYLFKTREEIFYPPFNLKKDKSLCFAHSKIIAEEFRKNPIDEILGIKHVYLNWLIYGKMDEYLSFIKISIFIYRDYEIQKILDTIDMIFSLGVNNDQLRSDLVQIIRVVPVKKRETFINEFLNKNYYISNEDPLYLFLLEELERTGDGEHLIPVLLRQQGVNETVWFLNKLARIHPESVLAFAKNMLACGLHYNLTREEDLYLFLYALSINPDLDFTVDLIKYMKTAILPHKFNLNVLYPKLEGFFGKIKHFREAHDFLYLACECAIKNNEFLVALQIADWDKNKSISGSSSLVVSSAENITPFSIVDLVINKKSCLSEQGFGEKLLRLTALSDCLKNYQKDEVNLFPEIHDEKIMQMEFLTRSNCVFPCEERFLTLVERCFLSLGFHLWYDGNYDKVIELIIVLEDTGKCSILFPLLEKISGFTKDKNYNELLQIAYRSRSREFLLKYLKQSRKFTEFHMDLMNQIKATSVITKKSF